MIFKSLSALNSSPRISHKDIAETYSWMCERFVVLKNERRKIYSNTESPKKNPDKQSEYFELRKIEDFILNWKREFKTARKNMSKKNGADQKP